MDRQCCILTAINIPNCQLRSKSSGKVHLIQIAVLKKSNAKTSFPLIWPSSAGKRQAALKSSHVDPTCYSVSHFLKASVLFFFSSQDLITKSLHLKGMLDSV